jgi:hypothetical protein
MGQVARIQRDETPAYLIRHHQAIQAPRGIERAIVSLRAGLLEYGLQYGDRFEGCALGDDGVIGVAWLDMARGYLGLLNCETGRLDCGTLDGEVRNWARKFGFDEKEVDTL